MNNIHQKKLAEIYVYLETSEDGLSTSSIVLLSEGDKVPADTILIAMHALKVNTDA